MISVYSSNFDRRPVEQKRQLSRQLYRSNTEQLTSRVRQARDSRDIDREVRNAVAAFVAIAALTALWVAFQEE